MEITLAKVLLPCSAAQLENALLKAIHNGHWHDAEVKIRGDQLVITHKDEDACLRLDNTPVARRII